VGPRTGLDVLEKGKISCPYWDSNQEPSISQPSLYKKERKQKQIINGIKELRDGEENEKGKYAEER
jgi:hypothetical protein